MSILGIILPVVGLGGIGAAIAFIPGAAAVAGKLASGALAFLSKLPPWVFVVVAAALVTLWALHAKHAQATKDAAEIARWKQAATNSHTAFLLEKKAFATTKDSLDRANGEIADNNARIKAAADELAREQAQAAADEARNARRAKSTDAEIAALQSAATDPKRKPCTLSDEAKKALGDL